MLAFATPASVLERRSAGSEPAHSALSSAAGWTRTCRRSVSCDSVLLPFAAFGLLVPRRVHRSARLCRRVVASGPEDALQRLESFELSKREAVEERLVGIRTRMDALRRGETLQVSSNRYDGELKGTVLWCDTDADVGMSADILRGSGLVVRTFTEPEVLLEAYRSAPLEAACIMSSMMEGNGRKERGAMNAFDLFAAICASTEDASRPLLAVISCSADERAARAAGADIVVLGSRAKAQNLVVTKLRKSLGLQAGYVGK
eukprot:TRINITY_DN84476_c0_g1_i1.p1 TRINITY_DN84476_c0_g1~~TRINITY_DN84476_c0_g1_i1.p1  ORF type:complete len:278 (-),score=54.31 TRINITY_DN84476_c0_g1_i1:51-830(-)